MSTFEDAFPPLPQRGSGPRFPFEVLLLIAEQAEDGPWITRHARALISHDDFLASRATLLSLAKSCRALRDFVLPLLYREVVFAPYTGEYRRTRSLFLFFRTLLEMREASRAWVRRLCLGFDLEDPRLWCGPDIRQRPTHAAYLPVGVLTEKWPRLWRKFGSRRPDSEALLAAFSQMPAHLRESLARFLSNSLPSKQGVSPTGRPRRPGHQRECWLSRERGVDFDPRDRPARIIGVVIDATITKLPGLRDIQTTSWSAHRRLIVEHRLPIVAVNPSILSDHPSLESISCLGFPVGSTFYPCPGSDQTGPSYIASIGNFTHTVERSDDITSTKPRELRLLNICPSWLGPGYGGPQLSPHDFPQFDFRSLQRLAAVFREESWRPPYSSQPTWYYFERQLPALLRTCTDVLTHLELRTCTLCEYDPEQEPSSRTLVHRAPSLVHLSGLRVLHIDLVWLFGDIRVLGERSLAAVLPSRTELLLLEEVWHLWGNREIEHPSSYRTLLYRVLEGAADDCRHDGDGVHEDGGGEGGGPLRSLRKVVLRHFSNLDVRGPDCPDFEKLKPVFAAKGVEFVLVKASLEDLGMPLAVEGVDGKTQYGMPYSVVSKRRLLLHGGCSF